MRFYNPIPKYMRLSAMREKTKVEKAAASFVRFVLWAVLALIILGPVVRPIIRVLLR